MQKAMTTSPRDPLRTGQHSSPCSPRFLVFSSSAKLGKGEAAKPSRHQGCIRAVHALARRAGMGSKAQSKVSQRHERMARIHVHEALCAWAWRRVGS